MDKDVVIKLIDSATSLCNAYMTMVRENRASLAEHSRDAVDQAFLFLKENYKNVKLQEDAKCE